MKHSGRADAPQQCDAARLVELQLAELERFSYHESEIVALDDEAELLDEYLCRFAVPQRHEGRAVCLCCQRWTNLTWLDDTVHGEARCACGWPYRVTHRITAGGRSFRWTSALPYHPLELTWGDICGG